MKMTTRRLIEVSEETYQDDLRYERAVWPERFSDIRDKSFIICLERITCALQGIDLSLEKLADKPPILIQNSEVTEVTELTEITEVKKK